MTEPENPTNEPQGEPSVSAQPAVRAEAQPVVDAKAPSVEKSAENMPKFQIAALLLSGTGFALSLLLEKLHVDTYVAEKADHFCSLGSTLDCASVAASPSSIFLGLPWAVWGALGFLALAIASYRRSRWLLPLSGVSAVVSVVLFFLSAFSIGSICLLCEGVHLTSLALFVLAYRFRNKLEGALSDATEASRILAPPAALAVTLLVALPPYWSSFSWKGEPPFPSGKTEDGYHWIGAEKPEVTIHEYVNYKCPHCKTGSSRTLRELGKNPTWRIVRHPQPLMRCMKERKASCQGERLVYCAGEQGKFWKADRWLFANVDFNKRFDPQKMVQDLELDGRVFAECFEGPAAFEFNDRAFRSAKKKGLIVVPSYEIDAPGGIPESLKPLAEKTPQTKASDKPKTLRDLIEQGKSSK
jgi:uncharacterized membrane protein